MDWDSTLLKKFALDRSQSAGILRDEWLPVLMHGSFSEIYVMDAMTLKFVYVNRAAQQNLQYSEQELLTRTPLNIARNLSSDVLEMVLDPLRSGSLPYSALDTTHVRKDGSAYPVEFHMHYCPKSDPAVFIGIANDISFRYEAAKALRQSESRYRGIVSNTPGLVFQLLQSSDGSISYPYLSEGCLALLGVSPDTLRADSELFHDLILPEDRASYWASMHASARDLKAWNWDGRIWIEEWQDIKWINLRATPRILPNHGVQWDGIMTNITASKQEQSEIKRSRAQLAELSAHIDTVKEQERMRIAREIHDDLGGNLTAIKMALLLLARRCDPNDELAKEKVGYIDSLVDRTIETVHRIAGDLRPSILDFGLVDAIAWQAREFEKQTGMPCEFVSNKKEIDLHPDQATALFRIFQEALTNISKHAGATAVEVRLVRTNRNVRLDIADDGCGIDNTDKQKPKSFGIRNMIERTHALGGTMSITGGSDGGTVVSIRIPV